MCEYVCHKIRIVNGNTIESDIELGFDISIRMNIKLYGVDDSDRAQNVLEELLTNQFICRTMYNRRGRIGRVLGYVYVDDQSGGLVNINNILINQGFGKQEQ